ncbi:hypothetical protein [Synechococcus sp. CB0101]|nr:hypothetical protein [Synechococcus sp. CB0101]
MPPPPGGGFFVPTTENPGVIAEGFPERPGKREVALSGRGVQGRLIQC